MAREPRDYDVLVPLIPGESRQRNDGLVYQTLHAIYGRRCRAAIESQLVLGQRQVIGFFPQVRVRTVDQREIVEHDPTLRSFFNANNPEALDLATQIDAEIGLIVDTGSIEEARCGVFCARVLSAVASLSQVF